MEHPTKTFAELSDLELVRAVRGQPAAFEALFERHAMALRQWLFAQTGDAAVSQDLLGETFAQAWRGLRRFRGVDDRSGIAWLYAIARHLVYQHYKGLPALQARSRGDRGAQAARDGSSRERRW